MHSGDRPSNPTTTNAESQPSSVQKPGLTRRAFLSGSSALLGAGALSACSAANEAASTENQSETPTQTYAHDTVAFDGEHQAGVATHPQAHLNLVGFNLRAGVDKAAATRLMRLWTEDARELAAGQNPLGSLEPEMFRTPANLTITCGVGPRFFDIIDKTSARPSWLKALPEFDKDQLQSQWGQTDIVLQICCDDPTTLAFVTRHMVRASVHYAATAWMQQGFLHAHGVQELGETPRNLFGQKDGTVNPRTDEEFDQQVWIGQDSGAPSWLVGGTSLVVRRIRMNLDTWELLDRTSRELSLGRTLDSGAPLGQEDEFDPVDLNKRDQYGLPMIDPRSHVALAMPSSEDSEEHMLRRAYNYDLPPEPGDEQLSNAGLVFCAFQKDPVRQFVPVQQRLNDADRLNEWITHIGSAVYAILPGTDPDDDALNSFWGAALLQD